MKTLEDYTNEIKAKTKIYNERCTKDLYSGVEFANFDLNMTTQYIEKIYSIVNRNKPVVIVANDPKDYANKFRALQTKDVLEVVYRLYQQKNDSNNESYDELTNALSSAKIDESIKINSHFLFLASAYHRVYLTWYKFIQDEFKIDHKNVEILNWLYENANNNISRCYFTKLYVLILRMPKYIRRNNVGFHSIDGAAIEWEDYSMYYINGRKLYAGIFNAVLNKTYTFNEFIAETDENTKASVITLISEKFGSHELVKFLNASITDEQTLVHSSGNTEVIRLWKTNEKFSFLSDIDGNPNQPYAWLEMKCPSTQSIFFISTSPHFDNALESIKFHRPKEIPMDLPYNYSEFNN